MDLDTAKETLMELLDASVDRLPDTIQTLKINEAMRGLETEFSTPFNEGVGSVALDPAKAGIIALWDAFGSDTELQPVRIETAHYIHPTTGEVVWLVAKTYEELDVAYPRAVYLSESGWPTAFAHRGMNLHLRPFPTGTSSGVVIHCQYIGHARELDTARQTNMWMRYAPHVLLYEAAALASIWMVEEERAPVFRQLRDEAAAKIGIEFMMHKADETQIAMEAP